MANEFASRKSVPQHKKDRRAQRSQENARMALEAAQERQEAHDKLSTKEKIAKLDMCFGVGLGAVKERARLTISLNKEILKAQIPVVQEEQGSILNSESLRKRNKNEVHNRK